MTLCEKWVDGKREGIHQKGRQIKVKSRPRGLGSNPTTTKTRNMKSSVELSG